MKNATHVSPSSTLLELLEERAALLSDAPLFHFVEDSDGEQSTLPYSGLLRRAQVIGTHLQQLTSPGERAVLLYPPGLDYVSGFFGCLASGVVAVPAYPPDPSRLERTLPRLRAIIQDCQASVVLTTSFILSMAESLFESAPDLKALRWVATDELPEDSASSWRRPALRPDSLAFLQYTSGSTGTPKGVMLSHANLLHNLELIHGAFGMHTGSTGVIWLPPYHDMGLIGGILGTVYGGFSTSLLSPLTFLRRPLRWLEVLSRTRGTISGGPNFAFDLCVRKTTEAERASLDLSHWEVAFCGAEPIRPETLERFAHAFAPSGFRREAFYPCYGLAEGTLIVSGGEVKALPVLQPVDTRRLREGHAEPAQPEQPHGQTLVGCGHSLREQQVRVVHPETLMPCVPGEVGEVWVKGPSVALGYWGRPEDTARDFHARTSEGDGPFLRTGDQGFLQGHELFITGRIKDLIIIRGRNHHPQDIELTAERASTALRPGCGAAFSVEVEGEERLVLVYEADTRRQPVAVEEVARSLSQQVATAHELRLHALTLISPGSLPKTSSGKIQRRACRAAFLAGELQELAAWREQQSAVPALHEPRSSTESMERPGSIEEMEAWLRPLIARRLKVTPEQLEREAPLTRYGVDSLAAVELTYEVEKGLGVELPLHVLLSGPTLIELARRLFEQQAPDTGRAIRGPLPRASREQPLPLSFAQQRMWLLEQLEPGSLAYHLSAALKLAGELDVTALERSVSELVRRHEALRTTFHAEAGEPRQVVSPPTALTLTPLDLSALPSTEREAEVRKLTREDAHRPFDLAKGPLLRLSLLRLGEREHVLLVTLHHIIADGWSAGVLVRELGELYGSFRTGRTPALAEPSLQYADFATWQRATLQGEEMEAQRAWWSQHLADVPESLELPTDRPRRAATGTAGMRKVLLPSALVEGLEALARQESGTLFMAVLAGLKVLLSRYSGQDDFLIGSPFANRGQAGTEGVVGLFFEPLVFRARLAGNPTFRELLARTRGTVLEGFAHPHVPFESLGRRQPFQVIFNQLDAPLSRLVLPGLQVEALETVPATTELDVTVTLGRAPDGVWLEALYNADLFEAATLERLLGHLRVLLEGAVRAPESHVKTLPLLSAEEQQRVLVEWNATREGPVGDARVHALIEAQAARTPEALAVVAADGATLTYAQLMERAHRLANFLRARGVRPEERVGLCLERSPDMVVALLGILGAGAAYVPLDSAYPAERLTHMVESSGIRVLLVHERTRGKVSGGRAEELCLDEAREAIAASSAKAPPVELPPEAAAYVLFTSGSTGQPKGVVMSHRSLVNYTRASARFSPMSPGDRLLQFASISWDTSAEEIYTALTQGGTLVLRPPAQVEAPEAFLAWCEAQGITQLNLPTAFWHELVASLEEGHGRLPRGLKWLIIGGERAVPERVAQWMRCVGPSVPLLNTYGITEVMAVATAMNLAAGAQPEGREVCIGRPVLNVRTYVLDEQQQPVPVGVTGELYVGGEGVARGYLEQPAMTAERFVPDAFATEPGQRLYRSGDKARWRADGTLEYLGRGDSQVKVRGFRIEPGEVEAAVLRHPRVHEVLVLVREDVPGDKQLVAYAVPRAGQTLDVAELKGWLAERLPPFMVPQALVALPALPLLPNGKVNRRALPAPQTSRGPASSEGPRTPLEQKLAALWKELLRLEHVGVHDSFFELGGHSLLATRLVSRIRSAFGVELPLRALFEAPTLSELAARLESAHPASGGTSLPPLTRATRTDALPLSFAQQRLWFLHQFDPDSAAYNIPGALRLTGSLDGSALRNALTELVRRHESLRTTFHNANGEPVQRISPPTDFPLAQVDLRSLPEPTRTEEVQRLTAEDARRPFELATGPLLRGSLLRLGEHEHVLLLNMHHIVSDGWSMDVLVREVAALYEAFSAGKPSPLPELPVQYADYSVWQRSWMLGETLESQLSWWRKHLEGAPAALELPTELQRPSVQSFQGATVPVRLSRPVSEALKALCRKEGVTPFMALLATYQLLLSRYSGQEDITVGSPIAGRRVAELEGLIGFFVNTLALRTCLEGNPSFCQVLARVKETTLGAFAHQDVPFEKLVEELTPTRTLGRSPLFQVLFALQNVPQLELQLPGFSLSPLVLDNATSRFELELNLTETADGFAGELIYNRNLFSAAFAQRFSHHFATLLEGLVSQPERPFHHLPLLSSEEHQKVLVDWNHSPSTYPRDATITDVFERQVAATPDAIALEFGERRLTYRQLDEASNRLAHVLCARGVGADSRVALALDRSLELIVSLLGILKAGGAYVPLDTSYPRERLSFMLEDAQPALLVTTREQLSRLPADGLPTLLIEESAEALAKAPGTAPRSVITSRNLAYIDFTSGSTGRPKGVCIEHASVLRTVLDTRYADVSAQQSFLLIAPISFDASTLEVWGPLLNGGRLVVFPPHSPSDLQELAAVLQRHSVTTLHLTSGLFTQVVDNNLGALRGVRQLLTGGDVVSSPHVRRVLEQLRIPVTACYGPTEGTLFTSCFRMTEPSHVPASVPIGTPISSTQVYLLDSYLQPVPPGTPGELYISGDGLARGYLQQPALTAERFLPNPFSSTPGARLYRTGDLARHRSDGVLEFLGRADFQVKVRGFRIELGEVEAALLSHPEVREAIVLAREDAPGHKRLVGYVTGKSSSLDTLALRAYLQQRLPEYMVPSALLALDSLPLTPNGKVDRKALPAPDTRPEYRAFVPPSTPTEVRLAALWSELLGLSQVSALDDFFELGGHSLLATRLVSLVRSTFGVELPLRALFEEPTLAGLAARLESSLQTNGGTSLPPLTPAPRTNALPLSFAQQRLWILHQFNPDSAAYNIPGALRLTGSLDGSALRNALTELVRRHESLRTTFHNANGEPVQRISPPTDFPLAQVDLRSLPEPTRAEEVQRLSAEDARRPFELATGPLLRGSLLRLGEHEHVLLLNMHHIVSDGWSMDVLVREVAALYEAFSAGKPSPLPELPVQYADYSVWQRSWMQGETLGAQLSWWRKHLEGAPTALELPTELQRPSVQSFLGATIPVRLSRPVSESLKALCRKEGVTPFMALLATYQLLLSRYSGQEDITVGSPIAGRRVAELEGLIGFFVNTLALRTRMEGNPSFRQVLARVKETTLGAFAHQDVPFEKLVEELTPTRTLGRSPLFQVLFALQNSPQQQLQLPGLAMCPLPVDEAAARFELELNLTETMDGFAGELVYNRDLFSAAFAQRFSHHFATLLEGLVSQPEQPFHHLPLLSSEERQKVLVDWNHSPSTYPRDATISDVFERQVAATPDAIALEFGERRLTYRQLDEASNRLAHVLCARGVGADSRVALALDRSLELIVSLLGILKAGGAYVPLDTSYPRERLSFMLEDARPALLITTREQLSRLPAEGISTLLLEDSTAELAKAPGTAPRSGITPRNLAYIDFTSGSTGRPKGVCIEHASVLRTVMDVKYADVSAQQSFLLIAPISFDASTLEVWGPLLNGGRLVVFPPHSPSDLQELAAVLQRHSVTTLHLTSGLFTQVVDNNLGALRGVRQLLTGGDVVSSPHVRRVLEQLRIPVTACYGPTEGTLFTSCFRMTEPSQVPASVPIGTPISSTQVYLLDSYLQPVPPGTPGELYISGDGLARGYLQQPALTAERFLPNPFSSTPGARLYRTGDLARHRSDGVLEFLGRADFQVKVRGFRIELGEVEAALLSHPEVREAIVLAREDAPGHKRLVGYVTGKSSSLDTLALRAFLQQRLPEYMVPSALLALDSLPLTPNGKVDRKALPAPDADSTQRASHFVEPSTPLEQQLVALWSQALGIERVGVHDHFFQDLGGNSLSVIKVVARMREVLQRDLPFTWIFEHPTIHALARRLTPEASVAPAARDQQTQARAQGRRQFHERRERKRQTMDPREHEPSDSGEGDIAIIGMSGRFPGARSVEEFWSNLRQGLESISRFSPEELERMPRMPEGMDFRQHPQFVPAGGVLEAIEHFDHGFFDISLREAQWMDPQQRLFLQCAWAALEDAGYVPERTDAAISLYAGAGDSGYLENVLPTVQHDPATLFDVVGTTTHVTLATKASFKLGLTGESLMVQTACSTGLVAVHMACQSLLSRQSDLALAGAAKIDVPQRTGYVYQEGLINSPDGHCRAFDARARGTVTGNGVTVVVLKRLSEALRDGDHVYAVIKGSAINNDGRFKSGFTAPSVQGQAAVIEQALAHAGLEPEDIGYVETHGTATPLGDPIEVAALQRAYGLGAEHRGTIPIGSVKTNLGHLDAAAGLAGLMKAALALHHEEIPPSLHFERPNPAIDFDAGPFFVNASLRPWKRGAVPRRAAVSSFGVGGTNAHAVLEEALPRNSEPSRRPHQLLLLSARTPGALEERTRQLAAHVEANPSLNLADLAFTLAVGRKGFEHRRTLVVKDTAELVRRLRQPPAAVEVEDVDAARERRVAFLFPGQGAQQPGMGRELYESEPVFRQHVDTCLGWLEEPLRAEVRTLLRPDAGQEQVATAFLTDTRVALPALFTVEYALARLWMSWGVRPYAVLGHSYGEYVAACLAGVLSLEDGLRLAVARGRLMSQLPPGAMLAVGLSESALRPLLPSGISLAAFNAPERCVVSGPAADVERFAEELRRREVGVMRLPAPHAFHSADVEPFMPALAGVVASLKRSEPALRYVSSLTGTWARAGELEDPRYWADQMRQPVRFASGVEALLREGCGLLLEVGPGQDLTGLARACVGEAADKVKALSSLRRAGSSASEHAVLLRSLGEAWAHGLEVDWTAVHAGERRLRLSLPTYPFEEKRCWVEPARTVQQAPMLPAAPALPAPASTVAPAAPAAQAARATQAAPVPQAAPQALPRGAIEEQLAALWRERLGVEHVGRDDDFLELGGNSLMAAQLLTRMRDTFGVQLPLADLFDAPTVAGLAQRIEALQQSSPKETQRQLPLAPRPRPGELALSYVQERAWRAERLVPGLSAYHMPVVFRLEGPMRVDLLERSIQEIVRRHELLRTTYDEVDGRPVQRIHATMHVPLEVVVLEGTREEREAEVLRLAREDAARPIDLVKGPVLRTTLVRVDEDEHVLLGLLHHIASDSISCVLFMQEVGHTYEALREGRPSPLAPLPLQYADFGAWQKQAIAEGFLEEQQQWWRKQLAGLPRQLDLPTDRPRTERCEFTSRRLAVEFPRTLSEELAAFSRREGVTSFMTLLAAWKTLLHRYSGQSDILISTPIANRTHPELQPLIGYVAHSAALRTDLGGDPGFRELLGRVRQVVLDAHAHPDVPYEQLVQELLPERKMGRTRLADSVCVLHSVTGDQAPLKLAGMRATPMDVPGTPVQWGATMADLALSLTEEAGRVHGALEYAAELFDEARVVRMMEHLRVLLAGAMARPEERLSRLPLLSEAERRAWEPPRPAVSRATVLERLEDQAARHPEAVAILQDERAWTWAELSARASNLAARLRTLGVRTGVPVGVCLKASPEKLMALWGVMRAGGATVAIGADGLVGLKTYASTDGTGPLLLTSRGLDPSAPLEPSRTLYLEDGEHALTATGDGANARPGPGDLACILPTPGTAPAWTFTHHGLARFFETLDERLSPTEGGAWVAASETSEDRPELEPLWALSRGLRVVFPPERMVANLVRLREGGAGSRPVELSLSYFADDEDSLRGPKYELLLQGAKFADENGFSAVWTPERHFYSFGGLYPQPGVIAAALATHTRRLHIRAGSVVLPLHDPLQIAEQWSVVDNLSQGRIGVSVAGGWHSHDFVYAPDNYADRRNVLKRNLETLREVWRGKRLERRSGDGTLVEVGLRPRPMQRELPIWLTAASNPEAFRLAGEIGAGVLTNLLSHDMEQLRPKLALYREAWRRHGHAGRGHVTLMVHTFIGTDEKQVLNTVREPLMRYLRSSLDLTGPQSTSQGVTERKEELSEQDRNAVLELGLGRFVYGAGLIGTRESGLRRLKQLRELDVDEAACLIDFGLDTGTVLESLRELAGLREQLEREAEARREQVLVEGGQGAEELLELARSQGPAILQATAWLARRMSELPRAGEALRPLRTVVVEEASAELATSLRQAAGVEVLVSGHPAEGSLLPRVPGESLPLGAKAWVLDEAGQPVPVGVVGELALSGPGLPQGLWRAEEEERRRLVPHPLDARERLYRTGRYARLRADGSVEPRSAPVVRPAPKAPASVAEHKPSSAPLPLVRVPRAQPLPLSFAQQRMWYLQGFDPKNAAYNLPFTLRLSGRVDESALQAALDELVRRHEVLRTTYALAEQGAVQVIHPPRALPLPLVELKETSDGEREAELLRVCQAHSFEPFDLERSPPLRALLVRVRPDEHVLNLVFHHVMSDAWSSFLLAHELEALYGAFAAGKPSPLPELPVQYADYAAWQRQWLQGPVMADLLGWWKQQLAGVQPLELPLDKPRPAHQSLAGDVHRFVLPRAVVEPLLALGRREGATSFMVVMALYQTLLHRYTGQEDFAVGMPTAGRNRPEVEGLIGCFINTLALPARFSGQPSFRQLLGRVRQVALGAYAHQELPFERLVDELRLPRDLSRPPVFQVTLNLHNTPQIRVEEGPLRFSMVEVPTRTSKFDLSLEVVERDGGLSCMFEYVTDLFAPGTISRMADHLELLAREAVASPDAPLSRLPILTEAERHQVLREWNDTRAPLAVDTCIHHLFEAQVARTPDARALGFEGSWLTYRELDERSNQLAWHLRSLGVGPEVRVGLCAERSLELVVGLFAILKAGGAYVPLDPSYPRERLEWMLEDARPAVLLAQPALLSLLPEQHGATVAPLSRGDEALRGLPTHAPASLATADNLAYVLFTSGSTGRPKGVQVPHRTVSNFFTGMDARLHVPEHGVWLAVTRLSFDISVLELLWTLARGFSVVVQPDLLDTAWLPAAVRQHSITHLQCTPSLARALLLDPGSADALRSLQQMLVGGEALPSELAHELRQRVPSVLNMYGPTETTVWSSTFSVPEQPGASVPLGSPIANTSLYVLDAHLQPVPLGVPGELFIGGAGVVRGYLGRPELTAERFLPDPFSSEPGARLYRTGDKVRRRADGSLEFLGRIDFQVKVRGFRIELGEIEAALEQHPRVSQSVVMAREDVAGDKRLVAYLVPTTGEGIASPELDPADLRTFLKHKLPEYMVPSAFVVLPALPLNSSGKVDRKALPPPDGALITGTGYVAPRDETEQQLAEMWREVLRVERVGIHDNFFTLGGHSLMVTQIVSRVRAAFGVDLPLREFFEAPTVAELALNILQVLSDQVDESELESMVTQLDQLGDEEIRKLLESEPPPGDE